MHGKRREASGFRGKSTSFETSCLVGVWLCQRERRAQSWLRLPTTFACYNSTSIDLKCESTFCRECLVWIYFRRWQFVLKWSPPARTANPNDRRRNAWPTSCLCSKACCRTKRGMVPRKLWWHASKICYDVSSGRKFKWPEYTATAALLRRISLAKYDWRTRL